MKKLNNMKLKKLITFLVLDAIQIAMLLGLMVYSQVIAIRVMITCFPENCHKGTFGTFIAVFLVAVLCAVMLWMVLLILDRYKAMIFGEPFPSSSWKRDRLPSMSKIPPPPLNKTTSFQWVPINRDMNFAGINWNGIVFLVCDDGEITLTCGNLDWWSGNEPEYVLGDDENPAFADASRKELTASGIDGLLTFAGYINLAQDAEIFFREHLSVPEVYMFSRDGRLEVLEKHNFLLIYENGFLEVLSYHSFVEVGDETFLSCSKVRTTHRDCDRNRSRRYLRIGIPLKYIVNLDRCCLTDCRVLFDKIEKDNHGM